MKYKLLLFFVFLTPGIFFDAAAAPFGYRLPTQADGAATCIAGDRSGCGIRVTRGINEEGYYLTVDTGTQGADSVKIAIRGRSIEIGRDALQRTERTSDRGGYAFVSRSSRFAFRTRLPADADVRRISRDVQDGVITITVPRLPRPGPFGYPPYR